MRTEYRRFFRVSRREPCEICSKPDWCSRTSDGALALCMRSPNGSIKQASNGAYIHVLDFASPVAESAMARGTKSRAKSGTAADVQNHLADTDRRHSVYTAMLEILALTPAHGDHLLYERGLSDTTIAEKLYASVPDNKTAAAVVIELSRRFDLRGVPGFHRPEGGWHMAWSPPGFYVPYRDELGRIRALQVRCWPHSGRNKCFWFSSTDMNLGASSGTPLHFAYPDLTETRGLALLTEGALKADIIAERLQRTVIGVPGVSAFTDTFGHDLRRALPRLREVVLCFDADYRTNPAVRVALLRLIPVLRGAELIVIAMTWDEADGKGLDDVLLNEEGVAA